LQAVALDLIDGAPAIYPVVFSTNSTTVETAMPPQP